MAPLSKLTLTSYRRTQPNRDPVEERRSKTLAAIEQQKLVLAAAQKGQEHRVTKPGWARDTNGNRQRVEKTHAVRPWFFQDGQGWVVQLKYGARVVPLDADNNAVIVHSLDDVAAVLDLFAKAVEGGELDTALATHCNPQRLDTIQKQLPIILENALNNPSILDAHVFTLCELSGSFEPAMRLFKKRYGDQFSEELE